MALVKYAQDYYQVPNLDFTISPAQASASYVNGNLVSQPITVSGSAGNTFSMTLEHGVKIVNPSSSVSVNGSTVTVDGTGTFQLQLPAGTPLTTQTLKVSGALNTTYNSYRFYPSNTNLQQLSFLHINNRTADTGKNFSVKWNSTPYQLKIIKKDTQSGETLAGAQFGLYTDSACTNLIETLTTNAQGQAASQSFFPTVSTLYVKELKAPQGYILDSTITPVKVDTAKNEITRTDLKYHGDFEFVKEGEVLSGADQNGSGQYEFTYTQQGLSGVEYAIYNLKDVKKHADGTYEFPDSPLQTVKTDLNGIGTVPALPYGDYAMVETKTLNGFVKSDLVTEFRISNDTFTNLKEGEGFVFENKRVKTAVSVEKKGKDGGSGTALAGAQIGIYNKNKIQAGSTVISADTLLETVTTDEAGKAVFQSDLPLGQYYLKEVKAPDGYQLNTEIFDVNLQASNDTDPVISFEQTITDDPTGLAIAKTDEQGNMQSGSALQLVTAAGQVIHQWTSSDTPEVISPLQDGEYNLQETQPAAGYTKAEDVQITVKNGIIKINKKEQTPSSSGVVEYKLINHEIQLQVNKVDTEGKPVSGALLEIWYPQIEQNLGSFTSGSQPAAVDSSITSKMQYGHIYVLRESVPAKGYASAEPVSFELLPQGSQVVNLEMVDEPLKMEIIKTDTEGHALAGAELEIQDKDGSRVDFWISADQPHVLENKLTAGETYTLIETKPADGYTTAKPVEFTVQDTTELQTIQMQDVPTDILISKTNLEGTKKIAGAQLQITDPHGSVIAQWTSSDEPHQIRGLITNHIYTLSEVKPADGYVTAEPVKFTVADSMEPQTVEMKDDTTKVEISKTDLTTGKELPGASLEIRDKDGSVIESWISTDKPYILENKLTAGETYTLVETRPAEGYATAESVEFTVSDTGEIQKVEMQDDTTKVEISKTDLTTGKELPGASLEIRDKDGNVIESWISTDAPHVIENKLTAGETYMLVETKPADGYVTAESVEFTVSDSGEIQKVEMQDDTTKVEISKTDLTTGKELPGASLEIQDKDGNVIESWISTDKPYVLENKLTAGETYTLVETKPADGFTTAESVEFTVSDTGEIQKVEMRDDTTKVEISKTDITTGKELPGASLEIRDRDGNVIESWISTDKPYVLENKLTAGETYTLVETKPADGYVTAESVEFTVTDSLELQTIEMKDDTTKVEISKTDITTGKELPGASLEIRDKDGNVIESWISADTPHVIENKLTAGETYTLVETKPADGYVTAESVEFTISDTGEVQKVEMQDSRTETEISKTDLSGSKLVAGAKLQITDKNGSVVSQWTSSSTPHLIQGLIAGESYTLSEVEPASGYATAEPVVFTVKDSAERQNIVMKDDTTKVEISKTDLTTGKELPGASLEIRDKDGNVIESWISTDKPYVFENKLTAGETYTLVETKPADGYVTAESVEFTVSDSGEIQKVEMQDDTTKVEISKTDLTTGKELPGASLEIRDQDDNVIESWISTKTPYVIENKLTAGETYTLVETKPADGYATAESNTFTARDTGEVQKVEMQDGIIQVEVQKLDEDNKPLAGAHLQILDADGKITADWMTTDQPYLIEKLPAGTYTLHEVSAPEGYLKAEDVTFQAADTMNVQIVKMIDKKEGEAPAVPEEKPENHKPARPGSSGTGVLMHPALWVVLLAAALFGTAALVIYKKKHRQ